MMAVCVRTSHIAHYLNALYLLRFEQNSQQSGAGCSIRTMNTSAPLLSHEPVHDGESQENEYWDFVAEVCWVPTLYSDSVEFEDKRDYEKR